MKKINKTEKIEVKIVIASIFSSKRQEKLFAKSAEKFMFSKTKKIKKNEICSIKENNE